MNALSKSNQLLLRYDKRTHTQRVYTLQLSLAQTNL